MVFAVSVNELSLGRRYHIHELIAVNTAIVLGQALFGKFDHPALQSKEGEILSCSNTIARKKFVPLLANKDVARHYLLPSK